MNLKEFPYLIVPPRLSKPHLAHQMGRFTVISPSEYLATNQLATSCVAFEDWESSIPPRHNQQVNGGYHLRSTLIRSE